MAIKYRKKAKDIKMRNKFITIEKKVRYYKFLRFKYEKLLYCNNIVLRTKAIKFLNNLQLKFQQFPKIRINNYCMLTGRDKGVYRDFKLSRHMIKQNFIFLTGLRNSSF